MEYCRGIKKRIAKGEWWEGWIQVWYIWYIVRTFINATMYPHPAQQLKKRKRKTQLQHMESSYKYNARWQVCNVSPFRWSSKTGNCLVIRGPKFKPEYYQKGGKKKRNIKKHIFGIRNQSCNDMWGSKVVSGRSKESVFSSFWLYFISWFGWLLCENDLFSAYMHINLHLQNGGNKA
jgi:hypothetical protein